MKKTGILIALLFLVQACKQKEIKKTDENVYKNPAKQLIADVSKKVGTYEDLKKLKNVEYTYSFRNTKTGLEDISTERYIFKNEASWAEYKTHHVYVSPKSDSVITQFFNGKDSTTVFEGNTAVNDPKTIVAAKFLRKANFYWFTMMQKLLDDGLHYELLTDRSLNGVNYKIVKIGFDKNIGDVQDDYVLYINPKTLLVDQFIFTVKGSSIKKPMLMKIKYEKIHNVYLMTKRYVYLSDWEGKIADTPLFEQQSNNIKFNNSFNMSDLGLNNS